MALVWMSAPDMKSVKQNSYTHGPAPWFKFTPDQGDICVAKTLRGRTVLVETWEGVSLPIPKTHRKA
jgi:hypothetical protein